MMHEEIKRRSPSYGRFRRRRSHREATTVSFQYDILSLEGFILRFDGVLPK